MSKTDSDTATFTVLVVDDTVDSLMLLTDLLRAHYTVKAASSGAKALKIANASPPPDLVLLDIMMPEMDGYEVCRQLKANPATRDIPVIFLTAKTETSDEQAGFELGALDYITKPIRPQIVLARVKTCLKLKASADFLVERTEALQTSNRQLHEALDHLKQTQAALVQAEKLASLGAIVAAVAHELNTPIGTCLTAASALQDKAVEFAKSIESGLRRSQLDDYVAENGRGLELLMRGLERSANLVASFKLVAADANDMAMRTVVLKDVLTVFVGQQHDSWHGTPYTMVLNCPPSLELKTYPEAIEQIFYQIASNALIHGFSGRPDGCLTIDVHDQDNAVRLNFRDNGKGMSDDVRTHVFDPFFTTQLGKGSSGLGMHICYNLATGPLGGTLTVASEPSQGVCFGLTVPKPD